MRAAGTVAARVLLSLWLLFAVLCVVLDLLPITLLPLPRAWQSAPPPSWHIDADEIIVFYHAAQVGAWERIMHEQLQRLVKCGLYDRCASVELGFLGEAQAVASILAAYDKVNLAYTSPHVGEHEVPTLRKAHEHCTANAHKDSAVLYIHTKGATCKETTGRGGVRIRGQEAWREMMELWVLDRHELCLERLASGYLTCGVYMHYDHYAGNFWWAQSRYLRTLDVPDAAVSGQRPRWLAEHWVLSKRQRGRHLSVAADVQEVERKGSLYSREVQPQEYERLHETFV